MKTAIESIASMGESLTRWVTLRAKDQTSDDQRPRVKVGPWVESIRWKMKFLDHYSTLLCNVRWESIGNLSLTACKHEDMVDLHVNDGLLLRLGSSRSAEMVVLASFDAAVAACVNSCDTLGRLINLVYGLGIHGFLESLPNVAKKVDPNCPLGVVMHAESGLDSIKFLRGLRGECQHAYLSEVLFQGYGSSALEPVVAGQYCPDTAKELRVSEYLVMAKDRTLKVLTACARAIAPDPENAVLPRC